MLRNWLKGVVVLFACGAMVGATGILVADEDAVNKEATTKSKNTVGNPLASWLVDQMVREIKQGLKDRNIEHRFAAFQTYAGEQLDYTAGKASASEITGNCRLSWYDHLMRNPLKAPGEAEQFTSKLHQALRNDAAGLDKALIFAREKMDAGKRESQEFPEVTSPEKALEILKQALVKAETAYVKAIAPLSPNEIAYLNQQLYPILTEHVTIGHTLWERSTGRYLCDLLEKMDRKSIYDAADALLVLSDARFLAELKNIAEEGDVKVESITGKVLQAIDTPAGKIIIGGRGNNVYELDKLVGVSAVIDLGGEDIYHEGTVSPQRSVLVVIDLDGNDRYEGAKPGIQGGAMLGISMLIDAAGNDIYNARDIAQGSAVGGVGILIDCAGDDRYQGHRRTQGQALGGVGILLDKAGKDDYRAAMWTQGFGGPLGFGVLDDLEGNDRYYCGGMWRTSYYPETPGYEGWGQGVGAGLRGVTSGGIGVILDGSGDDVYEYDYFGQGGGYWQGAGFARDFAGNDRRLGGTRKAFDGSPRTQPMFDRFSCGFGCHYAIGFCFDDSGDDTYGGTIMGLGFSWDCSNGFLCDFAGNDRYEATGGLTEGDGAQAGLGVLLDYTGDDTYQGSYQGYASSGISYHSLPRCGGNFSFLIDYGGNDAYGCGIQNNSYTRRGCEGGFLIDRPLQEEMETKKAEDTKKVEIPTTKT